jgi:carbon monoxide dehydrogenase subunit G
MQFENSFLVPMPPDETWALLLDVRKIAPCLPGAELSEVADERHFRGQAKVKVGPVQLSFAGTAELAGRDDVRHEARLMAKGTEGKGRGNASATVDFTLKPEGAGTQVTVKTDLQLVGAVAQYGRGAGLIKEIANQLIGQFADNLRRLIDESAVAAAEERQARPATPKSSPASPPLSPSGQDNAISGLSLFWSAFRALFGRWMRDFLGGRR